MGCSIPLIQNTRIDSISSDDLQESEVSLDQIHEGIAYLKINVQKQKEIYPEDNITIVEQWVNCHCNSLRTSNKSDTNSKKSCLKSTRSLSQYANSKKVHFVQQQQRNNFSQNVTKKKSKKKRSRRSKQPQQRINLDDIF